MDFNGKIIDNLSDLVDAVFEQSAPEPPKKPTNPFAEHGISVEAYNDHIFGDRS